MRPQRSRASTKGSYQSKHRDNGPEESRDVPLLQAIDNRIEHVEQHPAQHDWQQEWRGEPDHHDDAARGKDMQRGPAAPERSCRTIGVGGRRRRGFG